MSSLLICNVARALLEEGGRGEGGKGVGGLTQYKFFFRKLMVKNLKAKLRAFAMLEKIFAFVEFLVMHPTRYICAENSNDFVS